MTTKGFTEYRGTACRIAFDHSTGQFTQSLVTHPFIAGLCATGESKEKVLPRTLRRLAKPKNSPRSASQRPVAIGHVPES